MKTKLKLLVVLLAIFCISLICGLVAACKDEPEDLGNPATDGYRITVLYPDGRPVTGEDGDTQEDRPYVALTDASGNLVDLNAYAELNASGLAYIAYFVPGEYYINVGDYPEGYVFDNTSVKTSANRAYYTVRLKLAPPTPYTINLSNRNGEPMQGVTVKLMNGKQTVATATTDADGVATTTAITRGTYTVVLDNLPKGYTYKTASTTIAAKPLNIKVAGATDIRFEDKDKLDEEGIALWDEALNSYALGHILFDKTSECYQYIAEFDADEEVFFTIHAPKTGNYTIGSKQGNDYIIRFYNDNLTETISDDLTSAINEGNNITKPPINEGETLNFSVTSASGKAGRVEILICLPVPEPKTTTAIAVGTYTLKFDGINEAILEFVTDKAGVQGCGQGIYTFTSLTDEYDVMIVEYTATGYPSTDPDSDLTGDYDGYAGDDNSGEGDNFFYTKTIEYDYAGNVFLYHVIIKGEVVDHPVQIEVKIERTGDAISEEVVTTTVDAHVDTKYADQTGTFTWAPTNDSLSPYRKDDGNWYVQVNGEEKALVVAITKKLHSLVYSFANVEYFGEKSGEDNVPTDYKQNSKLTIYEIDSDTSRFDYADFIKDYEGYVNADGVYQVNDELKLFLERYMNQYYGDLTAIDPDTKSPIKPEQPWLLGCGYYA